ncbi:MAG: Anaphase-promoting complex, cyclosome, subunit 3, partial [Clostridiales bacterium]|nr:Anaphase-promoting complex, cyclosome, subunit 3 [Clostridiales bacterium]MDN5282668.1 Anaphase-promoting complex, cyclosome, subunit 3 [Candidatus Ozemobacter sp.]
MTFQEAYEKGNEALRLNNYDEAQKHFEEALRIKPNDVYTMNKLAMVLKEKGEFDQAMGLLDDSLKLKKEDLYTNYLLGNTYLEAGD